MEIGNQMKKLYSKIIEICKLKQINCFDMNLLGIISYFNRFFEGQWWRLGFNKI